MKKEIPVRNMNNEEFVENIKEEIISKDKSKPFLVLSLLVILGVFVFMICSLFITNNKLEQAQATNSIEKIRVLNLSKAEKLQKQIIHTRDELQKKVDNLNITIRDIEKCKADNSEKGKAVDCLIFNK